MKTSSYFVLTLAATLCLSAGAASAQPKPPLPGIAPSKSGTQAASKPAAAPVVVAPAATGQLSLMADGATVLSADGKLIWMRCQIGQSYEKGQCVGEAKKMDQRDAANEIKRINFTNGFAGSKDWRLPSVEELQTLVFCEHGMTGRERAWKMSATLSKNLPDACRGENYLRPTIDPIVFPNAAKDWVWTATPDFERVVNMWAINFSTGSPSPIGRANNQTTARAVRSAK
jgi:hypothetical protein